MCKSSAGPELGAAKVDETLVGVPHDAKMPVSPALPAVGTGVGAIVGVESVVVGVVALTPDLVGLEFLGASVGALVVGLGVSGVGVGASVVGMGVSGVAVGAGSVGFDGFGLSVGATFVGLGVFSAAVGLWGFCVAVGAWVVG
ncbi:MAG: hypothetical protein ACYC3P_00040 [Bellilinea sp.]